LAGTAISAATAAAATKTPVRFTIRCIFASLATGLPRRAGPLALRPRLATGSPLSSPLRLGAPKVMTYLERSPSRVRGGRRLGVFGPGQRARGRSRGGMLRACAGFARAGGAVRVRRRFRAALGGRAGTAGRVLVRVRLSVVGPPMRPAVCRGSVGPSVRPVRSGARGSGAGGGGGRGPRSRRLRRRAGGSVP